jgi:recombinational DNA repair protein (RecF pathway)
MHHLHTTPAFVLRSFEQGETSSTLLLFTREHGMLYAHAQGVRSLRNRNRYALRVGGLARMTLVRGREVWRITSAQADSVTLVEHMPFRRLLFLAGKLLPLEDPARDVFDIIHSAFHVCATQEKDLCSAVEAISVVRILTLLGWLREDRVPEAVSVFSKDSLDIARIRHLVPYRATLVHIANTALRGLSL